MANAPKINKGNSQHIDKTDEDDNSSNNVQDDARRSENTMNQLQANDTTSDTGDVKDPGHAEANGSGGDGGHSAETAACNDGIGNGSSGSSAMGEEEHGTQIRNGNVGAEESNVPDKDEAIKSSSDSDARDELTHGGNISTEIEGGATAGDGNIDGDPKKADCNAREAADDGVDSGEELSEATSSKAVAVEEGKDNIDATESADDNRTVNNSNNSQIEGAVTTSPPEAAAVLEENDESKITNDTRNSENDHGDTKMSHNESSSSTQDRYTGTNILHTMEFANKASTTADGEEKCEEASISASSLGNDSADKKPAAKVATITTSDNRSCEGNGATEAVAKGSEDSGTKESCVTDERASSSRTSQNKGSASNNTDLDDCATTKNQTTMESCDSNQWSTMSTYATSLDEEMGAVQNSLAEGGVGEEDVSVTSEALSNSLMTVNGNQPALHRRSLPVGAHAVRGPDYDPNNENEHYEEYDTNHNEEDGVIDAEVNPVVRGFVPMSKKEAIKQKRKQIIQHLRENAITLDESAVTAIPDNDDQEQIEKEIICGFDRNTLLKLCGAVLMLLTGIGITIGAALATRQSANEDGNVDEDVSELNFMLELCGASAINISGSVENRFTLASDIVSEITPTETLENGTTPQSKALAWIVCDDTISSNLLNNPDPSGKLPNQTNGFVISGNSGEAQVKRRYALAVLYFSTTEDGPWTETGDYLNPELHECSWYKNFTRQNFPFGKFDPMGVVCHGDPDPDFLTHDNDGDYIRNDDERKIERITINFRVPNNLTGSLPAEFGHLVDVETLLLENHLDLAGPIPHSIGNMTHLESISILFMGPNFGGPLPESLFQIQALEHVTFMHNKGNWTLPEYGEFIETPRLISVQIFYSGFSGPLPHWLSQSNKLTTLELSGNNFSGEIPDSFQYFSSLKYLSLFGNRINSTLPSSLGELKSLTALVLGDNNIQGSIPSSIGKLTQLDLLHLGGNDMTSTIPQSFAKLSVLKSLVLDSNHFDGTIEALESLKEISTLFIHNNRFSGTIPGSLFSSTPHDNVHADFGNNQFRGVLPSEFGDLQNLTYLAATQNGFDPNAVDERICNNTPFLVMDCSSCSCCNTCCQNSNRYCDFHPNEYVLLGLECSAWYMFCGKPEGAYDVLPTD